MHSDQPLLSILIPTRNRAFYLRYAIQSALNVLSSDIEVIVSENHGSDDGWQVANSYSDPRLKVVRPSKPLPMHENWEFLLRQARGRWVTFIGDDDAVMPHCAEYLSYLDSLYPEAEAIVSPRAYYFWEQAYTVNDEPKCSFSISHHVRWQDSKEALRLCLADKKQYLYLPQIYSGGFQRRSLIQRVLRLQGGHYFRSVTPDAYSAVAATLHTYRYLEVGMPMAWVGTSPHSKVVSSSKDRTSDFTGMHDIDFCINPALGDTIQSWPHILYFFEAYIAAAPFTSLRDLSWSRIRSIYRLAALSLVLGGNAIASTELATSLGVKPVNVKQIIRHEALRSKVIKIVRMPRRIYKLITGILLGKNSEIKRPDLFFSYSSSGCDCPTILSSDHVLTQAFHTYSSSYINSSISQ